MSRGKLWVYKNSTIGNGFQRSGALKWETQAQKYLEK